MSKSKCEPRFILVNSLSSSPEASLTPQYAFVSPNCPSDSYSIFQGPLLPWSYLTSIHWRHFDSKHFCCWFQLFVVLLCILCFIDSANSLAIWGHGVSDLPLEPQIRSTWYSAPNTVSVQWMLAKLNWEKVLTWITTTFAARCKAHAFTKGSLHQIPLWEVSPVFPCVCT